MSRRDTIIIALLVNASLLALLFILAVNTDDDTIPDHPEITKTIVDNRSQAPVSRPPQAPIILLDTSVNDEVDNFLKDLAAEESARTSLIDEEEYTPMAQPVVAAAKPIKKTVSDSQNYVEVTVKKGDVLEKIAKNNGTTVEAIKTANNLANAKLSIGQVLRIPLSSESKSAPAVIAQTEKKPVAVATEAQYYTIKSGDNPWNIAKQFNVKFEDLLKLNHLDEEKARNMKIGDRIRVK